MSNFNEVSVDGAATSLDFTGINVSAAKDTANKIADNCAEVDITFHTEMDSFLKGLAAIWYGPNAIKFETEIQSKMDELVNDSFEQYKKGCQNLCNAINRWGVSMGLGTIIDNVTIHAEWGVASFGPWFKETSEAGTVGMKTKMVEAKLEDLDKIQAKLNFIVDELPHQCSIYDENGNTVSSFKTMQDSIKETFITNFNSIKELIKSNITKEIDLTVSTGEKAAAEFTNV